MRESVRFPNDRSWGGRFEMPSAYALGIFCGKFIFDFAFAALCGAQQTLFHERGCKGKQQRTPQCRTSEGSGTADAVSGHDLSCENAMPERPQTLRHCSIKNNNSAEHGQSAAETILNHFDAKRPPGIAARRSLGLLITQPWSRALPQP